MWAIRDVFLLSAVQINVEFVLCWTHAALGHEPPSTLRRVLRGVFVIAVMGIGSSFLAIATTNRQSYKATTILFVIALNFVWAITTQLVLGRVLPELEKRCQNMTVEWVTHAISEARLSFRCVRTANLAILVAFPALAAETLLKGAHYKRIVPHVPLDAWVGDALVPSIAEVPADATLNLALEIVELLIGWLQVCVVIQIGKKSIAMHAPWGPSGAPRPNCGYVDWSALGFVFQDAMKDDGKSSE